MRFSGDSILLDGRLIKVDAEPGRAGDVQHSVLRDDALPGQAVAQGGLFFGHELENERVRDGVQKVQGRGDVYVGGESVVHHRNAPVVRKARDLHRLGEAAAPRQVHLDDVDLSAVHQLEIGQAVAFLFAGRDADLRSLGKSAVAFV